MKKILICLILLLSTITATYSFTLEGGVSFTVESARIEAFNGIKYKIDINNHKQYFTDQNFQENKRLIDKKKFKTRDRLLTVFSSDGAYAITYKSNKNISYYYDISGRLKYVDYKLNETYPIKYIIYNIKGDLDSVVLDVGHNEQFMFDINKKLGAHWIGNNCYNEKGELIDTRN